MLSPLYYIPYNGYSSNHHVAINGMGVRTLGNDSQYKLSFEIILLMQSYRMFSVNPVLVVLSIVTCTAISAPVQTPQVEAAYNVISVNDSVPAEASVVDVLNSSSNWLSTFKIKEMMESVY